MGYPARWQESVVTPLQEEAPNTEAIDSQHAIPAWGFILVIMSGIAVFALAVVGFVGLLHRAQQPSVLIAEVAPKGDHVAVASSTATRRVGFVVVSGEVVNHSNAPLKNVEAVVELLDAHQHTIKLESGMIELDPLPSGRISPFQVELMDDARAITYRVHFKRLMGAPFD